uniref:SMAD family member 7 n=1 Tax=Pavo cristatus TaxID=9049 RepID=A0A8C9G560_PAVCR
MFRTKRSLLVRRLWRSRAPGGGEEETGDGGAPAEPRPHSCGGGGRGCCPAKPPRGGGRGAAEGELKALTHAVLKRCKERQLEGLLRAVESRGAARTPCVLLPARGEARLGAQRDALPALLCRVFRWPELRHGAPLKRLRGCCQADGAAPTELVCCNPHHLSRLCELESPPPPYSRYPMDFLKPTEEQFPCSHCSALPCNHCSALFGPGCWSRDEPHGIDWNWPFHFQLFSQKMNGGSPSAVVTWVPWWGPILPRSNAGFSTLQGPRSGAELWRKECCCGWVAEHGMFCCGVKKHEGKASGLMQGGMVGAQHPTPRGLWDLWFWDKAA